MAKKLSIAPIDETIRIKTRDQINVKMTQGEINERAVLSCKVASELDKCEQEASEAKKEWNKRIQAIESKLKNVQNAVRTGEEFREVDCERAFDLKRGVTWLIFEGKNYLERPATQKEIELLQQGDLEEHMEPGEYNEDF
jgi:hypothetical protein